MTAITIEDAALELQIRRKARKSLLDYISYTKPGYKHSSFSRTVTAALDKFIVDVKDNKRPILVIQAPPQHGKSEMVSRKLPPFLLSAHPDFMVATASYNSDWAQTLAQDVRRALVSEEHLRLFPPPTKKRAYLINTQGEFTSEYGHGGYKAVGVHSGLTGRTVDVGIIDDPIKDQTDALNPESQDKLWSWYQSVFTTRLSENSGQIIMATSWGDNDLPSRVCKQYSGDPRLKILRFPAINDPKETGYNPELPLGALVPELKSLEFLKEIKGLFSAYWWSALYQQNPMPMGGNVFKSDGVRYYFPKDLPKKYDKIIASWDCTFKDTDGTDFVVGQVWGKTGANSYLLDEVRDRMSFTRTVEEVVKLKNKWPAIREILIEDKANGPAVIDVLKKHVPGIIPIEPDGSKLARAHAITSFWEAGNIWLPHEAICAWIKAWVEEICRFPAGANDDRVDAMTQAIRRLYPLLGKLKISEKALARAMGR